MNTLPPKKAQVLETIRDFINENGYSPTAREVGEAVGLRSSSSIHAHIQWLYHWGLIDYKPNMPRTIRVLEGQR